MHLLKKLIFALPFLIIFTVLIYQINPLLASYDFIFSFSLKTLTDLILISLLFFFSSFLFILFATLASDWKIILPVAILGSAVPLVFAQTALSLILAVAIFISLLITSLFLDSSLKKYLTFEAGVLLGPNIRNLSSLLVLAFCLIYFFSVTKIIAQNGFQIPDSLIDAAVKITSSATPNLPTEEANLSQIPADQLDFLKKNPDLLKQYGIDPKMLDTLSQPKSLNPTQTLVNDQSKKLIKETFQNFLKPYIGYIPAFLAILLFSILETQNFLLGLFTSLILGLTFLILEKTGFTKFVVEQREVKKLVV